MKKEGFRSLHGSSWRRPRWHPQGRHGGACRIGTEGQRKADLGNDTYRSPIVSGDRADPTILKDGADCYGTFSSFQLDPGAAIWHSRDLVNGTPIGAALRVATLPSEPPVRTRSPRFRFPARRRSDSPRGGGCG